MTGVIIVSRCFQQDHIMPFRLPLLKH